MNRKQGVLGIFLGMLVFSLMVPTIHAVTTRKDALIAYVLECDTGAGFTSTAGGSVPTVENTYQALYILNGYGKVGDIDTDSVITFVNSCLNVDYGFGDTPGSDSDIDSTYFACWIFDLLNTQIFNYTYIWVADCQNGSAGFGEEINGSESVYSSYFGIEALTINGTDLSNNNVSSWLIERQNINPGSEGYGGFATDRNSSNMWATWAAMGSLSRLNKIDNVSKESLTSWINSSQNLNIHEDDYGGFSSKPTETDYSLLTTYAAIYSLDILGSAYLSRINLDAALDWLIDLQNEDGGFHVNSLIADSSLSASYYAFAILNFLGELSRLDVGAPWDTGFEMPIWGWVLIGIGIAIVAIILIKKYYID